MDPIGGTPPFAVTFATRLLDLMRGWGEDAARLGFGGQYLAALRDLEQHLRTHPREWGDPLYDYQHLSMTLYQRYTPVFVVRYAVHTTQPVVFVREIVLTPGSPLAGV